MMSQNIKARFEKIQVKEKEILEKILNNVLPNTKEKELIRNIITSFFELNKRFEYIKASNFANNKPILNILTAYDKSIGKLIKNVNSVNSLKK